MFERRRFRQKRSLVERLLAEAKSLRENARALPIGIEKERLLQKARQADTAAHMDGWLSSPGLMPPE
ncbi:hypothetical protein [Bradyrhizobium sp. CCBAU 53421]|uniref:hypothetical protein n=1 Tax=Bradyrhizobium sp. CCBAU 53421 TaxID=1325120 RepID=UPI00188A7FF4|nr:hypothetical protein [Bradyrhizobium sp. CCBAU 53421]QOZ34059.1 hypothetical protein XH92_22330 [Bradyrhizobium sp. CCBAU 53421]